MEMIAPAGPVYQAGTLSGNPLAMTAGIETLSRLREAGVWETLETTGGRLLEGLTAAARSAGITVQAARVGTMFGMFFSDTPVVDWDSAAKSDLDRFAAYHRSMLEQGVYLAPSQFEAGFISTAHGDTEIDKTVAAAKKAFSSL